MLRVGYFESVLDQETCQGGGYAPVLYSKNLFESNTRKPVCFIFTAFTSRVFFIKDAVPLDPRAHLWPQTFQPRDRKPLYRIPAGHRLFFLRAATPP